MYPMSLGASMRLCMVGHAPRPLVILKRSESSLSHYRPGGMDMVSG